MNKAEETPIVRRVRSVKRAPRWQRVVLHMRQTVRINRKFKGTMKGRSRFKGRIVVEHFGRDNAKGNRDSGRFLKIGLKI
jgi:hypothetical protein